jgi:hypothetical protein
MFASVNDEYYIDFFYNNDIYIYNLCKKHLNENFMLYLMYISIYIGKT